MLILLPPSEGKRAPVAGAPVDLTTVSHPALTPARKRVGDALAKVSSQRNAFEVLGVGRSLAAEVQHNRTVWDNPADVAARVYSGVLYEAAGAAAWTADDLARAATRVRIMSALWGAVSPADRIPAYRLSMGTRLGRLGALAPWWRHHLATELADVADGLVVDCRSASYASVWQPAGRECVAIRVERDVNGRRTVVSHMAKHTRGVLTGRLVTAESAPTSTSELADVARGLPGVVDITVGTQDLTIVVAGD